MKDNEQDWSLKQYFVPLTTLKAIHIITIVGFVVFGNALFNGFVWDDLIYIVNNQQVHTFNIFTSFGENRFNIAGQYRPIPSLYFSSMYSLFRDFPFFYHFFSICIHIISSLLVFVLFSRFFKNHLSLFLSLVFLVHPMQVESASFVSTSGNNLFFVFGLLALILSMKEQLIAKRLLLIGLLLLLSLLSKETGILFLLMIFVLRIFYQKKNLTAYLFIGIGIIFVYLAFRFGIGKIYLTQQLGFIPIERLSLEQRLINIPAIIYYYLSTFFLPLKLTIMQYWVVVKVDYTSFYLPLFLDFVFFACLGVVVRFLKKRTLKVFIFFFLWFFLGMLLHLQIFPLNMTVADRWFYFAMVGLLGVIGIILQKIVTTYKNLQYLLLMMGVIILVLLSLRTVERNTNWQSNLALYSHDAKVNENFILENNLGVEYRRQQNLQEAKKHFERSVQLHPYQGNLFNLAIVSQALNDKQQAIEYFFRILTVTDFQGEEYRGEEYNRRLTMSSWVLIQLDSPTNAKAFIQKALIKDPNNGYLWANLAISEYKLNNREEALKAVKRAKIFSATPAVNNLYTIIVNKKSIPENITISFFNEISNE